MNVVRRRCGICGEWVAEEWVAGENVLYAHMLSHPIPKEARPKPDCIDLHKPLQIIAWDAEVTLDDITWNFWRYDSMPEIFRFIIEDEYHAGAEDFGYYYPKTTTSATALDEFFHKEMDAEFGRGAWNLTHRPPYSLDSARYPE